MLVLLPFVHFKLDTSQISGALPSGTFHRGDLRRAGRRRRGGVGRAEAAEEGHPRGARGAFTSLVAVARDPRKLTELFGGALGAELLFALTLAAVCRGYGVHLGLAQLVLVNVIASSLAGLVPVPGGIGAAEAALAGGLVAMGVPGAGRVRDRAHPSALHLLPAADPRLLLARMAPAEGARLTQG